MTNGVTPKCRLRGLLHIPNVIRLWRLSAYIVGKLHSVMRTLTIIYYAVVVIIINRFQDTGITKQYPRHRGIIQVGSKTQSKHPRKTVGYQVSPKSQSISHNVHGRQWNDTSNRTPYRTKVWFMVCQYWSRASFKGPMEIHSRRVRVRRLYSHCGQYRYGDISTDH